MLESRVSPPRLVGRTLCPLFGQERLLERLPKKIQPSSIKVIDVAVGPSSVNKRGSRIHGAAECFFGRAGLISLKGFARLHTLELKCAAKLPQRLHPFHWICERLSFLRQHISRYPLTAGTKALHPIAAAGGDGNRREAQRSPRLQRRLVDHKDISR